MTGTLAVLYEHPEWFKALFAALEERGIPLTRLHTASLSWDPEAAALPRLVLNRMSPSAWQRGHAQGIFTTLDYLVHLEERGVPVVNGSEAFRVEISKARQLDLFRRLLLGYPRTRVINHPMEAPRAAQGLRFPVAVKPNIGGSGAGIVKFESMAQLESSVRSLDLGLDRTALVQEFLPARDGCITRVEILNGEYLYAIRIWPDFTSFNLCPADVCDVPAAGEACAVTMTRKFRTEAYTPPWEVINACKELARAAHLDIGGIEYMIDDRDGTVCYYDVNALSNFVANAETLLGFNPTARFADYLAARFRQA